MIKLETLRVYVTVAEAGNIKEAAIRLCRTASAVSMTLKQLEIEMGGPLFETDRKDSLTALGSFVLETGRTQIQKYDQAINKIRAFADNRIGRLALACVPSVAANLMPMLLPKFVASRPGMELELHDLDSRNVRHFVETGRADIGISGKPTATNLVSFEPLFRDRFKVVCAAGSRLTKSNSPVTWDELVHETLVVNGASEVISSPHYRRLSDKASFTVQNVTSLVALTKAGLGVTLLPALSTTHLPDGVVALELEDEKVERDVGLIKSRSATQSPVAIAFREFLYEELPSLMEAMVVRPTLQTAAK